MLGIFKLAFSQGAHVGYGALGGAVLGGGLGAALADGGVGDRVAGGLLGAGAGAMGGAAVGLMAHGFRTPAATATATTAPATATGKPPAPPREPTAKKQPRPGRPEPASQVVRDRGIAQQQPTQGYVGAGATRYKFDPAAVYHVDMGDGPLPMHYVGHDASGHPRMRSLLDSSVGPVDLTAVQAPITRAADKHSWSLEQARAATGSPILPASDEHLAWHDAMFEGYA